MIPHGPSLRERAQAYNPQPLLPVATRVFALALWTGCALADWSGFARVELAAGARALAWSTLGGGLIASCALVALVWRVRSRVRRDGSCAVGRTTTDRGTNGESNGRANGGAGARTDTAPATEFNVRSDTRFIHAVSAHPFADPVLCMVALALVACALGAGLRYAQAVGQVVLPVLATGADEPQLVVVEVTVASGSTRTGFGSDILARHFRKPAKFQCLVREVVLIDDAGARVVLHPSAKLAVGVPEHPPPWTIGDRLRMTGRLAPIGRSTLPSEVDYGDIAAARGIVGTLSIDSAALATPVAGWRTRSPFMDAVDRARETLRGRMREALLAGVPVDESGQTGIRSMLVALVLGDVEDGYRPIENGFRAAGLAHILAISGFNLAVLGWVVGAVAALFVRDERLRAVPVAE